MIKELNLAIEKWQQQVKADEAASAGMVSTMEYSPSDELRDVLNKEAPLAEPFSPAVRKAFGQWLAMPVNRGWKYADQRAPATNLYRLAVPFFATDMAEFVDAHNQLNRRSFAA